MFKVGDVVTTCYYNNNSKGTIIGIAFDKVHVQWPEDKCSHWADELKLVMIDLKHQHLLSSKMQPALSLAKVISPHKATG